MGVIKRETILCKAQLIVCIQDTTTIISIVNFSLLVNDPTVDWTVRHGHAIALSAVLHDAVERIVTEGLYQAVTDAAVTHASTDRVSGKRFPLSFRR